MKSNKGQALVEFVIILPVSLLLIFTVSDFGSVISLKSELDNVTSDVVTFYQNGKTEEEIDNIINTNRKDEVKITISPRSDYVSITAEETIKPITPGLSYILKDVFD